MNRYLLAIGLLVLVLTGCQSSAPVNERVQPPPKSPVVVQKPDQLVKALVNAQRALERDNLMKPVGSSAFDWYKAALRINPDSAEAHWGMRQISARYLELAKQAFVAGNDQRAELMLSRAQRIAASPADLQAIRDEYASSVVADNAVELPLRDLTARNQKIKDRLASLAVQARDLPSRLLIVARNDAEGRWIYQQMRTSVDGVRLRGNIEIGSVPRVVLLDLAADG